MTTIAYSAKHKILCSDSRASDDHDAHFSTIKKVYRLKNGSLYANSGDSDDRDLRSLLSKASPRKMPSRTQLLTLKQTIEAIVVFPKGQCFTINVDFEDEKIKDWNAAVDLASEQFVSIGSGYQFALGAMSVGASPLEAVRAACKWDLKSALPLQWEKL